MRPRHKSLKMGSKLVTPLDHRVKVIVSDKDHGTFEPKALGKTLSSLIVDQRTLGHVRDDPTLSRVKSTLKKVNSGLVKKYVVSIIEHKNLTLATVLVEQLVQGSRLDIALDRAMIEFARIPSLECLLDRVGLTESCRTGDDQRVDVTSQSSISHKTENFKALCQLDLNLLVGLHHERLMVLVNREHPLHGLGRVTRLTKTVLGNPSGHMSISF